MVLQDRFTRALRRTQSPPDIRLQDSLADRLVFFVRRPKSDPGSLAGGIDTRRQSDQQLAVVSVSSIVAVVSVSSIVAVDALVDAEPMGLLAWIDSARCALDRRPI
jgi:hypothetical protein